MTYNHLKYTVSAVLVTAIIAFALWANSTMSHTKCHAVYDGHDYYVTDDGHIWEYHTENEIPEGTDVYLLMENIGDGVKDVVIEGVELY